MLKENVALDGKTVLVTGAAGFIGANLVKRLFADVRDIRVVGIDSITDYYDVNIKYGRLSEIEALKTVRRMAREQEIKLYGKTIRWSHIVVSKKVYSRKRKHAKQYE